MSKKTTKKAKRRLGTSASKKLLAGPSQRTITQNLKELRALIDTTKDPILCRIAYEMETAVRWATEKTVGWPRLRQQALEATNMLRVELQAPQNKRYS